MILCMGVFSQGSVFVCAGYDFLEGLFLWGGGDLILQLQQLQCQCQHI